LAAGVLLLSGWDGQGDFLDPMCSGTFLAEAAMIACNIPQNINRKDLHSKNARLGQ
jgi:putative N6-adenine-specific DNA methylase